MFSDVLCEYDAGFTDIPSEAIEIMNSYKDGFTTGRYWPDIWNHRPGGPFVLTAGWNPKPQWIEMARISKLKHEFWMKGWDEGNALKLGASSTIEELHERRLTSNS